MTADLPRKRRRLGALLARMREERGWKLNEAAAKLGYRSPATVNKIESGAQKVTVQQLPHILEVYEVRDPALREQLRRMVQTLNEPDWWESFDGVVDESLSDYLSEIETASSMFVFNPLAVHGLLQTPGYARAVTEASRVWETPEQVDRFVELRIAHQNASRERTPALSIHAILTEGMLRQEVGGRAVQRAQLEHLAELASNDPNVTLQVLPFSAGAHAGMDGPFMLLRYPTGRDLVRVESMRASLQLDDPDHVELYRATSDLLAQDALPASDTQRVLTAIAQELT